MNNEYLCCECYQPAEYALCTQFSGDHPLCVDCAKRGPWEFLEPDHTGWHHDWCTIEEYRKAKEMLKQIMITDRQRQVLDCLWLVIPKPVVAFEFCAAATRAMSACGVIDLESCIYYLEPIHPASAEYIGILRQPTL